LCAHPGGAQWRIELVTAAHVQAYGGPEWLRAAVDPAAPLVWLDTRRLPKARDSRAHSSFRNACEAALVATVAAELAALGLPARELGATSPYSRQVAAMAAALAARPDAARLRLRDASVMTIDRFQGQDRAAMVVSLARSNGKGDAGALLADFRRVNVALTRARTKLILVGDSATVSSAPVMAEVFAGVRELGHVVELQASGS
jgi:superfamily I DNA and/or RNA helicase